MTNCVARFNCASHHRNTIGLIGMVLLLWCAMYSLNASAADAEKKLFRTGLTAKRGMLSVAPDGSRLLFTTESLGHGLRLLDLRSGAIQVIPPEPNRIWEMPNWSHDGKQVVAVSTAVRDNRYIVGDQQLILLDPATWRHRAITTGDGVRNLPFFSANGKRVYYFKGVKRERGKTPASRFDLFSVDLDTGQERQLTDEKFYQAGGGCDGGESLVFSAIQSPKFPPQGKLIGWVKRGLFRQEGNRLTTIAVDTRSGLFEFSEPALDQRGNLYFIAATERPDGGNFLWFLVRSEPDGTNPKTLAELPISMGFGIARNTDEIWAMDRRGDELVFRSVTVAIPNN
ncbi:MAG: PD40 domain-containing protein [Rhodocyclales bacterium]|nr:PD40 domain-containing protein [Rhodocyclales bacterium]